MAKVEWVEQRLQNWANWKLQGSAGALGYAGSAWSSVGRSGYAASTVPVSDIDAAATDVAVKLLPVELLDTVVEYYTGEGRLRDRLQRLGCAESTLHDRIGKAHRLLAVHFADQRQRSAAERGRVDALQRTVAAVRGGFTR